MVFFDFNVPFLESANQTAESSETGKKNQRLKLVVKDMELGYSGVAYNRTIKGVLAESDRCQIPLFPLSSLLKAAPALSSTVRFHRELLGVRLDSPFRQYTRLTVAVETAIHASSLTSGNPVLKTYDLVAVRPLNQAAFDQACKVSEVDLISIDFSQKLPFRLKLPMVKSAIERGLYFEITYSHLISDVHARRQILSGAQLLVEWTRGKNIILSSAAPTANELRGPYDVANLSSLLGLSMERAKAAISKNCRSLLANARRKKLCFKEAIRIEQISNDKPLDSGGDWFGNWHGWDPISSGEGDLSLDDIGKLLSAAHNMPKISSGADVVSVVEGMPMGSLQLKDHFSTGVECSLSLDTSPFFLGPMQLGSLATTKKSLKQSVGHILVSDVDGTLSDTSPKVPVSFSECDRILESERCGTMFTIMDGTISPGTPPKAQISHREGDQMLPDGFATFITPIQNLEPNSDCDQGHTSDVIHVLPMILDNTNEITKPGNFLPGGKDSLLSLDDSLTLLAAKDIEHSAACNEDLGQLKGGDIVPISVGMPSCVTSSLDESLILSNAANVTAICEDHNENSSSNMPDGDFAACDMQMEGILTETKKQGQCDVRTLCNIPLQEDFLEIESQEHQDDRVPLVDDIMLEEALDEVEDTEKRDGVPVADNLILEEVADMKERKQEAEVQQRNRVLLQKGRSVKGKYRRKSLNAAWQHPVLCMLKPVLFKRKASRQKKFRALQ